MTVLEDLLHLSGPLKDTTHLAAMHLLLFSRQIRREAETEEDAVG
jgi:hypothetical protein